MVYGLVIESCGTERCHFKGHQLLQATSPPGLHIRVLACMFERRYSWGHGRTRCLGGVRSVVHPTQSDMRAKNIRIHCLGDRIECFHGTRVEDVSAVELQVAVHPESARAADAESAGLNVITAAWILVSHAGRAGLAGWLATHSIVLLGRGCMGPMLGPL